MGTYAYMPPEQALGDVHRVDERADVFGLGAILCEILTGAAAYTGTDSPSLCRKAERADLADAFARLDGLRVPTPSWSRSRGPCSRADPDPPAPATPRPSRRAVTAHLAGVQDRLRASELARVRADAQATSPSARARKLTVALAGSVLLTALIGGGSWLSFRLSRDAADARDRPRGRRRPWPRPRPSAPRPGASALTTSRPGSAPSPPPRMRRTSSRVGRPDRGWRDGSRRSWRPSSRKPRRCASGRNSASRTVSSSRRSTWPDLKTRASRMAIST